MDGHNRGGKTPLFQNINLSTLEGAKNFYAEVIAAYSDNLINESNMRALVYALSNYLPFLKFEKDMELEKEIAKINERLEAAGR